MATHDYIISNASGAAVRADLNNALAAIVSNNSKATSPATTYAYQWWADTTTGQLKLRNSANSAWITIFELDGTMLMEDGTVSAPGLAFASDLNTGFFRSAADKINFATGGAERLEIGSSEVVFNDPSNDVDFRVESNGNTHMLFVDAGNDRVGIGASSPGQTLQVQKSSAGGTIIQFTDAVNATGRLGTPSSGVVAFGGNADHNIAFGGWSADGNTFSNERLRIDGSGRLLVGTSSSFFDGSNLQVFNSNFCAAFKTNSGSSKEVIRFFNGTSGVGTISTSTTTTTYNTSSDYRLKENIVDVTDGITRVKQLQPKRFNFIADNSRTVDGFIAHEAQTVVPEAVTGTHDEVDDDNNPVYQGIDQSKLVPLLTAALQEAIAKIETLETKVAALEAE